MFIFLNCVMHGTTGTLQPYPPLALPVPLSFFIFSVNDPLGAAVGDHMD